MGDIVQCRQLQLCKGLEWVVGVATVPQCDRAEADPSALEMAQGDIL